VLEIAHQGTERYVELAAGSGPIEGVLYRLDPSAWVNGVYELRLRATDSAPASADTLPPPGVGVGAATAARNSSTV